MLSSVSFPKGPGMFAAGGAVLSAPPPAKGDFRHQQKPVKIFIAQLPEVLPAGLGRFSGELTRMLSFVCGLREAFCHTDVSARKGCEVKN